MRFYVGKRFDLRNFLSRPFFCFPAILSNWFIVLVFRRYSFFLVVSCLRWEGCFIFVWRTEALLWVSEKLSNESSSNVKKISFHSSGLRFVLRPVSKGFSMNYFLGSLSVRSSWRQIFSLGWFGWQRNNSIVCFLKKFCMKFIDWRLSHGFEKISIAFDGNFIKNLMINLKKTNPKVEVLTFYFPHTNS